MARGELRTFLSEHTGDARPDTLLYLRLPDVDSIAAEFWVTAEDAPWAREIELRDPDGNRLRIGTPFDWTACPRLRPARTAAIPRNRIPVGFGSLREPPARSPRPNR